MVIVTCGFADSAARAGRWMRRRVGASVVVVGHSMGGVIGVLLAGLLLGRPGHEGLIPSAWIERPEGV